MMRNHSDIYEPRAKAVTTRKVPQKIPRDAGFLLSTFHLIFIHVTLKSVDKKMNLFNLFPRPARGLLNKFIVMKTKELLCIFAGHKDDNWLCHCQRCNHITKGDKVIHEQLQREQFEKDGDNAILPYMITKKHKGGKGNQAELRNRAVVVLRQMDPEHFSVYKLSKLFERDWTTIDSVLKLHRGMYEVKEGSVRELSTGKQK